MRDENIDQFGYPAQPTRVYSTAHPQNTCWRSPTWRERMNDKRRARYRAARLAGHPPAAARLIASRAP